MAMKRRVIGQGVGTGASKGGKTGKGKPPTGASSGRQHTTPTGGKPVRKKATMGNRSTGRKPAPRFKRSK